MWLSQLALVNFRNLAQLRLEPEAGALLLQALAAARESLYQRGRARPGAGIE